MHVRQKQKKPQTAETPYYTSLYNACVAHDAKALAKILKYVSFPLVYKNRELLTQLALEGKDTAIAFLRSQIGLPLKYLARGYAEANAQSNLQELFAEIAEDANATFNCLRQMVQGYARANDETNLTKTLAIIQPLCISAKQQFDLLKEQAIGFSLGNHVEHYPELLAREPKLILDIAYGTAINGNIDEIQNLLARDMTAAAREALYIEVAEGLAQGDHKIKLGNFLQTLPKPMHSDLMVAIVRGKARSNLAIDFASLLANTSRQQRLRLIDGAVKGYIRSGYLKSAKKLLSLVNDNNKDKLHVLRQIVKAIMVRKDYPSAYAFHQQTHNAEEKKTIGKAIINYFLDRDEPAHAAVALQQIKDEDEQGLAKQIAAHREKMHIFAYVAAADLASLQKLCAPVTDKNHFATLISYTAAGYLHHQKLATMPEILTLTTDAEQKILIAEIIVTTLTNKNVPHQHIIEFLHSLTFTPQLIAIYQQVIYHFGKRGAVQDIELLTALVPFDESLTLKSMLKGLVKGGHIAKALTIYHAATAMRELIASRLIECLSDEGDFDNLLVLLTDCSLLQCVTRLSSIRSSLYTQECFANKTQAVITLAKIPDSSLRRTLAENLEKHQPALTVAALLPRANELNQLVVRRIVTNYQQGVDWLKLTMTARLFLLTFHLLAKEQLSGPLALRIAAFLAPLPSGEKALALGNQLHKFYYGERNYAPANTLTLFGRKLAPFVPEEKPVLRQTRALQA